MIEEIVLFEQRIYFLSRVHVKLENIESVAIIRPALRDINKLREFYLSLPVHIRDVFHPFPYSNNLSLIYFTWIVLSGYSLFILKRVLPKLGYYMLVACDKEKGDILGFIFMFLTSKEEDGLVANVGIITKEEAQGKGIGSKMYGQLIKKAKDIGVSKFRVTVMERNVPSTEQVKKLGYVCKGYTTPDSWNSKEEKNLAWELNLKKINTGHL